VEYHNFHSNLGVAYALNYAANLAIKNNFDFLLTMDQDSFLTPGMVDRMIENCGYIEDVGIISPLHRNRFRTQEIHTSIYEEVLSIKTSGNLLNLKIYQKAGPFNEDYFIDYIDIEYGMRLNLLGFKVLRLNNEILEHSEADLTKKEIMGLRLYPWNHQPIRWYYKIRNLLFLEDEYREHYLDFFWKEKIHYVKQFIKIFLFEKDKFKKVKFAFEGLRAYKNGITGIRKEK
jgi:rhamnosyltransferase